MKRLELINKIQELEEKKVGMENLKVDLLSYYCDGVIINANVQSSDFNRKYNGGEIEFDRKIFAEFLTTEINKMNDEIRDLIDDLQESDV